MNERVFKSGGITIGQGFDAALDRKFGVVSHMIDYSPILLLDFNAAYLISDDDYSAGLMRGYSNSRTPEMGFTTEIDIPTRHFSTHHETGTLKEVFDWIVDQGRGQWSMDHEMVAATKSHHFTFYFEDEMTGVWSKMNFG